MKKNLYTMLRSVFTSILQVLNLQISNHTHISISNSFITYFPLINFSIKINHRDQFVHIWNHVPEIIKCIESMKLFKKNIISHFLEQYQIIFNLQLSTIVHLLFKQESCTNALNCIQFYISQKHHWLFSDLRLTFYVSIYSDVFIPCNKYYHYKSLGTILQLYLFSALVRGCLPIGTSFIELLCSQFCGPLYLAIKTV